ncbi:winged helix-turn-helix transcriptional regulator [Rhodospirillaceae bacterium SYSU D60014]|uniref:winged helix-turn-helix transcriptional regulator n=1 Tax=Virgifigura deserti TaxID=2268457 RepID=UPI000E6758CF
METQSYGQFCPVAMAAEVLCNRWTMIVVRELVAGSTRFNELRRGVPRMSPALLSKRLKELEEAGVISRVRAGEPGVHEYRLTEAGRDLRRVVEAVGVWGQRWVQSQPSLRNLDPSLLMWDMRRNLNPAPMPDRRCVIHFLYPELQPAKRHWWLVVEPGEEVDLCSVDPGLDVDLYVVTDLRTMTAIWMGLADPDEAAAERMQITGHDGLARSMRTWLGLSPFAAEKKRVAG